MDEQTLRKKLKSLFQAQSLSVLATHREGQPYCSLVAFAMADELESLLFATTRATRKYANLVSDPRVALLVDSRANELEDFHEAMAATATGNAVELAGGAKEQYLSVYLAKHPHLADFVSAPTCALFRAEIQSYYVVNRFQNVSELHIQS